jgi:hypothetical protein
MTNINTNTNTDPNADTGADMNPSLRITVTSGPYADKAKTYSSEEYPAALKAIAKCAASKWTCSIDTMFLVTILSGKWEGHAKTLTDAEAREAIAKCTAQGWEHSVVPDLPETDAPVRLPVPPIPAAPRNNDADIPVDKERAEEQRNLGNDLADAGVKWAKDDGISKDIWFSPGTEMYECGVDTRFAMQATHAQMADAEPALNAYIKRVEAEQRGSTIVDVRVLEAVATDLGFALRRKGSGSRGYLVERNAVEQIFSRYAKAFPAASRFFHAMTTEAKVKVFNDQLPRLAKDFDYEPKVMGLSLGHRLIGGQWRIFRANSDSYLEMPGNIIAQTYLEELKNLGLKNAKAAVSYDASTTDTVIELSWHDPRDRQPRVGDPIETGFKASTDDRGGRASRNSGYVKQIQCRNCTILVRSNGETKTVHRGSKYATAAQSLRRGISRIRQDVRSVVRDNAKGTEVLLNHWGILEKTPLETFGKTPIEAFRNLIKAGDMKKKGVTAQMLMDAYRKRPSDAADGSAMSLANGFTQAAHTSGLSPYKQLELERVIGLELIPAMAVAAKKENAKALSFD